MNSIQKHFQHAQILNKSFSYTTINIKYIPFRYVNTSSSSKSAIDFDFSIQGFQTTETINLLYYVNVIHLPKSLKSLLTSKSPFEHDNCMAPGTLK